MGTRIWIRNQDFDGGTRSLTQESGLQQEEGISSRAGTLAGGSGLFDTKTSLLP